MSKKGLFDGLEIPSEEENKKLVEEKLRELKSTFEKDLLLEENFQSELVNKFKPK